MPISPQIMLNYILPGMQTVVKGDQPKTSPLSGGVLRTSKPAEPVDAPAPGLTNSYRTILASTAPITDEQGQNHGIVAITVDITKRKRLEKALQSHRDRLEYY